MKNTKLHLFLYLAFFGLTLTYFVSTYHYYPGLSLALTGTLDGVVHGKVYWDYGDGFNEFDSINVRLSAEIKDPINVTLGTVTIEPSGIKHESSDGYAVEVIVDETDYEKGAFIVKGSHEWGEWINYQWRKRGVRLRLFPGSRLILPAQESIFKVYLMNSLSTGVAKVSSSSGGESYYETYGNNPNEQVETYYFGQREKGPIKAIVDRYRLEFQEYLPLPQQRLRGIRFVPEQWRSIKAIRPAKQLTIRLKPFFTYNGDPWWPLEKLKVNGKAIRWNDWRLSTTTAHGAPPSLRSPGKVITFEGEIRSYEAHFSHSHPMEAVEILLDGTDVTATASQKTGNGVDVISGNAPLTYSDVSVESTLIRDAAGEQHLFPATSRHSAEVLFSKARLPNLVQTEKHPRLLLAQVLTAAFVTFIFYWIGKLRVFRGLRSIRGGTHTVFIQQNRWVFWCVLGVGMMLNMIILLVEWPGSLTPDSIIVHGEAKRLSFGNHNPYIYSLFVLGLYNVVDSHLSVIIFQMAGFHILSGLLFYYLYREGAPVGILFVCFCLITMSVPVTLLNITFWKDVLYTNLVLFWALYFALLTYQRFCKREKIRLQLRDGVALSILFLLLATTRHNGIVYLPVIPLVLGYFLWDSRKAFAAFATASLLLIGGYYFVLARHMVDIDHSFASSALEERSKRLEAALGTTEASALRDYLEERWEVFVATLGVAPKAPAWFNDARAPPPYWHSVHEMRWDMRYRPKITSLTVVLDGIVDRTGAFYGRSRISRFLLWNSAVSLVGLVAAVVWWRRLPLSAIFSTFLLYQTVFLFFVLWPRWRYLYYVYVGGLFLLPLVLFELKRAPWKARAALN